MKLHLQAGQIEPSSVIKTEYSTFTYFITSLDGSQTVTSTDIVVSSNVVTETLLQPTPVLEATQLASSNYVSDLFLKFTFLFYYAFTEKFSKESWS